MKFFRSSSKSDSHWYHHKYRHRTRDSSSKTRGNSGGGRSHLLLDPIFSVGDDLAGRLLIFAVESGCNLCLAALRSFLKNDLRPHDRLIVVLRPMPHHYLFWNLGKKASVERGESLSPGPKQLERSLTDGDMEASSELNLLPSPRMTRNQDPLSIPTIPIPGVVLEDLHWDDPIKKMVVKCVDIAKDLEVHFEISRLDPKLGIGESIVSMCTRTSAGLLLLGNHHSLPLPGSQFSWSIAGYCKKHLSTTCELQVFNR